MGIKQEYFKFLDDYFKNLAARLPLLYNWQYGLRFDLLMNTDYDSSYFAEVMKQSTLLFESVFDAGDSIYIVMSEHKSKRQRIRRFNYLFNQITDLKNRDINYYLIKTITTTFLSIILSSIIILQL